MGLWTWSFVDPNVTSAGCVSIVSYGSQPSYFDEMRIASDLEVLPSSAIPSQNIQLSDGIWTGEVNLVAQVTEIFIIVEVQYTTGISNVFNITEGKCRDFKIDCYSVECPGGTFPESYFSCIECEAGTYSLAGAINCSSCPPGNYQPDEGKPNNADLNLIMAGQNNCLQCPENTYSEKLGATSADDCIDCPDGQVSPPGSYTCAVCLPGFYIVNGSCTECPVGTYGTPELVCQDCPAGSQCTVRINLDCLQVHLMTYLGCQLVQNVKLELFYYLLEVTVLTIVLCVLQVRY